MTPSRLLLPLAVASSLVLGGAAVAGVLPGPAPTTADPTPAAVERAHGYLREGPAATYGSDYGAIAEVDPVVVEVPDEAGRYDAVVTVSFAYRTKGPGPFAAAVAVREAGTSGDGLTVRPGTLPLAPARRGTATLRFLVGGLTAGTSYDVLPSVSSTSAGRWRNVVRTTKVLVTVDLTPR
ncbi:hypothetical protein [Nocardioides dongkuii]|uniref:hypothetical protein n=1 Tax=Nocardioides dongkuii TaxID=2760089 RepID=UPI0015FCA151|nr:hypothetical protein [Nocardioides dongkuii]